MFPGVPLENKLAGNVVDLCPVGALGSKDFLYKQRVWYLKTEDSVCPNCATGCSVHADVNKDVLFRLRPRPNPQAQGSFMCDEGRYGYHYVDSADRFNRPHVRKDGKLTPVPYADAVKAVNDEFKEAAKRTPAAVWVVLSPFLTVEEAYLAAKWLKEAAKQVKLALGPVPFAGEDDTYPKDRRGKPVQPVKFTIRAEKCPNRRGVEEVLRAVQGEVILFPKVVDAVKKGEAKAVFLAGGYPIKGAFDALADVKADGLLLAVTDFFPSPATDLAKYVFPAAAFPEKEGTYMNHAALAQTLHKASRPPQETRQEGQLFYDLALRRGLFNLAAVRKELAKEVPFFGPLAGGVPELGVKLA